MGHLILQGDSTTFPGFSLLGENSLAITLDDTGTDFFVLNFIVLSGTTSVSVAGTGAGGDAGLGQIAELNNTLTTVTLSGSVVMDLGSPFVSSNAGDFVVTDIAATATSPTKIASSLTLINASATTGEVEILAGATNTSSDGDFDNGASLNADVTITYTGLTIKGGSGLNLIENDATNGIVTDGNSTSDHINLGGAGAKATLGTGTGDSVSVGISTLGTPEAAGDCLGDTVTFGAPATAMLFIRTGAEAGSTANTTSIGLTKVVDAAGGMEIDFSNFSISSSSNIFDANITAVTGAKTLTAAENAAVDAMAGAGVAFFNYKGSEYLIATNATETAVSSGDAIVKLVGVVDLTATNASGVVTLHA
jgi:hypothetical protein